MEINNSFYQLPSERALRAWRDTVPPGFIFAVKGSRFITHLKKLKDPERSLAPRFRLEWIASSEAQKFADVMTEMTEALRALGPSPYSTRG